MLICTERIDYVVWRVRGLTFFVAAVLCCLLLLCFGVLYCLIVLTVRCCSGVRQGGWTFMRVRDDRPLPNHISVYRKIVSSIRENITKEDVCRHCFFFVLKF